MNKPAELPRAPWSITARDLVRLRDTVHDFLFSPYAFERAVIALADHRGTINPDAEDPISAATLLFRDEYRRTQTARLYFVTAEMTAMSVHAGQKLPTWNVYRDDLPSPSGFMAFATPIGSYLATEDGVDHLVDIVAVSWGPTTLTSDPNANCWITFWSATNRDVTVEVLRAKGFSYRQIHDAVAATMSDLNWDNEVILSYNASTVTLGSDGGPVDPADHTLVSEATIEWIQTVRAAWLMMKPKARKPVTEVAEQPLSRTVRKRLEARATSVMASRRCGWSTSTPSIVHGAVRANPSPPTTVPASGRSRPSSIPTSAGSRTPRAVRSSPSSSGCTNAAATTRRGAHAVTAAGTPCTSSIVHPVAAHPSTATDPCESHCARCI